MLMVMEYVLESSAWSVGGLIVGYALGRTERAIWKKRKIDDDS